MDSVKENLISTLHIDAYGNKRYYLSNGSLHRTDGPAFECINGDKKWYFNGNRHREDGPAIEYSNGDKKWYLNGVEYPFEEWQVARKMLWIL